MANYPAELKYAASHEWVRLEGEVAVIGGRSFPIGVAKKRKSLEDRIKRHGFEQTMEAMAYTWFDRLVAIPATTHNERLFHC